MITRDLQCCDDVCNKPKKRVAQKANTTIPGQRSFRTSGTRSDSVVAEGLAQLSRGNGEREQYLEPIREQVRHKAVR
jgi:hypothetical protein